MSLGRTPRWAWIALGAIAVLAGGLFLFALDRSGYANTYYAAAALAASRSWSAFFFGSVDAGNFITIDKPPVGIWLMGLSVRLFGLSSWSILVPEALLGVATVVLLFDAVRRQFGHVAGLVAALVLTLTPVAVLMFRYDNPDALLTFLLVAAAWALVRALASGRMRWLLLSAVALGFAFNTKYLEADIVVPAFALVYLLAGQPSLRTRLVQLVGTAAALVVASGWWMVVVDSIPAALRPFIGGSTNNSVLDLVLGYDGLGRILGEAFGRVRDGATDPSIFGIGAGGFGPGFSGAPGLLRLFNTVFAGQISWLLPFALVALVGGLVLHARAPRTDPRRAGYVLWGGWLLLVAAVFSFASGIIHSYYSVILAPAIAALAGAFVGDVWERRDSLLARAALAAAALATAAWASTLLGRTPTFAPGLGTAALALAVVGAIALLLRPARRLAALPAAGIAVVLAASLAGPTSYALATIGRTYDGGDPHAGPTVASGLDGFGGFGSGGFGRADGRPPVNVPDRVLPPDGFPGAAGPAPAAGFGAGGDQALLSYLVANKGAATWIAAVRGANEAAAIELATGQPVMAMGGFSGGDNAPTLPQLQTLVAEGKLRYVILAGGGFAGPRGRGGPGGSAAVSQWIQQNGTVVNYGGTGATLYDLSKAGGSR